MIRAASPELPRRLIHSTVAALAVLVVTAAPAHAYIDPITGSIILQVIGAGILAVVLTVKRVWRKIGEVLRKLVGLVPGRAPRTPR